MATMEETSFLVRTDTDNDALQVPDGIETVLVNASAHRVFIPEGVEVVRLQTGRSSNHAAPRLHDASTHSPHWLRKPAGHESRSRSRSRSRSPERTEPVARVKRETVTASPPREREAERSLSLPSVPGSPPASFDIPPDSAPQAPLARHDEPDLFDEVPLRPAAGPPPEQRVVRQQPGRNGSARLADPARQPLKAAGHTHVAHGHGHAHAVESKWREQFQLEDEHSRPMTRQAGRACADVLCCWLGV